MVFNFSEIIDLIIMSAYLGYLFHDIIPAPKENYDPLLHYQRGGGSDWSSFKFAILATAPAVIIHELAHKFVAMGFGLNAVFFAFYRQTFTLALAVFSIISKTTGLGFILIVPGFVAISGEGTHLQLALTSLAGPLFNLILWLAASFALKKNYFKGHHSLLVLTKKINMFLFIFNMLPIPGFDGYGFYDGVINIFIN